MSTIPIFGTRIKGVAYQYRPSAYGLIRNSDGEFAVAKTPVACFLPGGGIDAGETPEQAVEREGKEECGLVLHAGPRTYRAIEICYSIADDAYYEKDSIFLEAQVVGTTTAIELDHTLLWLKPAAAISALTHESHREAVRLLCEPRNHQSR